MKELALFAIGLVVILLTFFAGMYLTHFHKDAWFAIPAIITVWVVRLIAFGMMVVALQCMEKPS